MRSSKLQDPRLLLMRCSGKATWSSGLIAVAGA